MTKFTFEGMIINNTVKAVLFRSVYWGAPMWLPRSQIEIKNDDDGHVVKVSPWLCNKKNLSEFKEYTAEEIEKMGGDDA